MTPETDSAIAAAWPKEWAKAITSKKRQQIRQRWRHHLEMEAIKQAFAGASCATCCNSSANPTPGVERLCCDLFSSFAGWQVVDPNHLCHKWQAAQAILARQVGG